MAPQTTVTRKFPTLQLTVLALGSLSVLFYITSSSTTTVLPNIKNGLTETLNTNVKVSALRNTLIRRGSGNYKLDKPTGVKPGTFSWSQYGQDTFVDKFLDGKRSGFFLEIGGYDGELHSNTLFFEKKRGWDGLLVEANPNTFQQMVSRDRTCGMLHACISKNVKSMDFKIAGGETTAIQTASESHLNRIKQDVRTYGKNKQWKGAGDVVTTTCHALGTLLDSMGVKHVDYFSLDVEGAEVHILNSIDFDRFTFGVLSIEVQENRQEIHTIMKSKGYERFHSLHIDDFYQKIVSSK